MKEIKTKLEDVKRIDKAGEKRHYYLDCRYEGELQYEFEGKTYRVVTQIGDLDFMRGRIMPDIYPTVLAYFGRERMPAHVFESVERAKHAIEKLELLTCPTAVSEKTMNVEGFQLTVPHNVLTVALKTAYTFVHEGETVSLEHNEMIRFLVLEV